MGKRKRERKARKRVPKEDRKNLRLWAEGARESVLTPHIQGYADALERGWRAERDYLLEVCREFHTKIDWRLQDHEEPELPLRDYNPLDTVHAEDVDLEEEKAHRERVLLLNKRIRRWFKYRVRRLRKGFQSKIDPLKDPWSLLVAQLAGIKAPPKARQAYQQFMHEAYDEKIAPLVDELWKKEASEGSNIQTAKDPGGPFRAKVARDVFAKLPQAERDGYAARAKQEAADAKEKYETAMKAPPSKAAEDRDKCIETVGKFLGPIMKGIFDRTGLHCCFLMGGPIPKYGGELKTVYASYGRNKTTAGGGHFPEWANQRFNVVTDLMKEYLTTAFSNYTSLSRQSPQERAEAALPTEADLSGAKYTLLPDKDDLTDDSSGSSDSESDSNVDSDDTEKPARKRSRTTKGKAAKASKAVDSDEEGEEETPAPAEWKIGDPESLFVPTQAERNLYGGGAHGRQQAMAARRNALLLAPLKEQWKAVLGAKKKPTPQPRKRKPAGNDSAPARKSRRLNGDGDQSFSVSSSTGPDALPPFSTTLNTSEPPPSTPIARPAAASQSGGSSVLAPSASAPVARPTPPAETPGSPVATPSASSAHSTAVVSTSGAVAPRSPTPASASMTPTAITPLSTSASSAPDPPTVVLATGGGDRAVCLKFDEDSPGWLRETLSYLTTRDLGCHYTALLQALVRLEESADSDGEKPLGRSKTRPTEIKEWIRGGRGVKMKNLPTVTNIEAYAVKWKNWWGEMQPKWRKRRDDGSWVVGGEYGTDWGRLDCSGLNGTVSFVAGLYFWGTAESHTDDSRREWEKCVMDVSWMLEGLDTLYE
ncbi:hypothetical protein DFH06DRAFT_1124945 [Mycena polygramma]|nr:hypothetical protein DFH06DRAFT_1124945 [Mycena polygramma]